MFSEEVCTAVVSFQHSVKILDLGSKVIKLFNYGEHAVESFEFFNCAFVSFSLISAAEFTWGRKG